MSYFVPIHHQKSNCIGCGCKIGAIAKNNIKKAISVGLEKAVDLWIHQQIVVNSRDHKMCKKCFEDNLKIPKISNKDVDLEILVNTLTSFIKSKSKDQNENNKYHHNQQIQFSHLNLTEEQCIESCNLNSIQLKELSSIIHQQIQVVFEFFYLCKQGISQTFASVLANKSQSAISQNFSLVLENLTTSFVPNWLGSTAFRRENIFNITILILI